MAWDSYVSGRRTGCSWLAVVAFFAVMGIVRVAHGDPKQEAKARFVAGQSHYNLNEFGEALREFKEAYRIYPDPVFLFNLGQCERQLEHYEEAIRFYRTFLREQPKAPNRQDVLHKIDEMETALQAKGAEGKPGPVTSPPSPLEPKGPAPAAAAGPAVEAAKAPWPAPVPATSGSPPSPAAAAPESPAALPPPALPAVAPPLGAEPTTAFPGAIDLSAAATPAPEAAPPPIYKRWWFWTAAAAVAIGAGVGIYAATAGGGATVPSSLLGSRRVF